MLECHDLVNTYFNALVKTCTWKYSYKPKCTTKKIMLHDYFKMKSLKVYQHRFVTMTLPDPNVTTLCQILLSGVTVVANKKV